MTSIAHSERTQLCALAQQLGPDAPTLCEGWTVRDLAAAVGPRRATVGGGWPRPRLGLPPAPRGGPPRGRRDRAPAAHPAAGPGDCPARPAGLRQAGDLAAPRTAAVLALRDPQAR